MPVHYDKQDFTDSDGDGFSIALVVDEDAGETRDIGGEDWMGGSVNGMSEALFKLHLQPGSSKVLYLNRKTLIDMAKMLLVAAQNLED